jgi:hypothetical protein
MEMKADVILVTVHPSLSSLSTWILCIRPSFSRVTNIELIEMGFHVELFIHSFRPEEVYWTVKRILRILGGIDIRHDLIERRSRFAQRMASGDCLADVVNDLSNQFCVGKRALYLDWQNRKKWMPILLAVNEREAFFLDLLSTHKDLMRLTRLQYFQADSSSAAVGALKLLRSLNLDMFELLDTFNHIKTIQTHKDTNAEARHEIIQLLQEYPKVFPPRKNGCDINELH